MLTVDYIDLQRAACELIWGTATDVPDSDGFARLKRILSKRLATAWERAWWPDLLRCERREFRATYASGTAYTVGTIVWHADAQAYYQALRSTTGNAPSTLSGGVYSPNYAYWYPAARSYTGDDWADATAYILGDVVRNPATNLLYACHTAHTSSGTFNASNFGLLTEFDVYVAWEQSGETKIGTVMGVFDKDPRNHFDASGLNWELSNNGVQVLSAVNQAWVRFRLQTPYLTGTDYSATATYAVDDQIYYSSATLAGNFYDCVTATTAGDSPDSAAAKWSLVEIPRMFERYLVQAAYADWLPGDGQNDKKRLETQHAENLLQRQYLLLRGAQGQRLAPHVTRN